MLVVKRPYEHLKGNELTRDKRSNEERCGRHFSYSKGSRKVGRYETMKRMYLDIFGPSDLGITLIGMTVLLVGQRLLAGRSFLKPEPVG